MRFLVTIDGVPDLDEAFLARLASETGRPVAEWRRALVAPALGRVVLGADRQEDAEMIGDNLAAAGLVSHVVDADEAKSVLEQAFEATWAEPVGDGFLFIGPSGEDLKVSTGSVRLIASGRQKQEYFVVLGLRDGVGAVIVRMPGADITKIIKDADTPADAAERFSGYVSRVAPHALVERGLEEHNGKLAGLDEIGSADLAHAPVVAAWLLRRFPPKPKPRRASVQAPQHTPAPSLELEVDHRAAQNAGLAATLGLSGGDEARAGFDGGAGSGGGDGIGGGDASRAGFGGSAGDASRAGFGGGAGAHTSGAGSGAASARTKRMRALAAGAVVVVGVVLGVVLHTPAKSEHLVHMHESWRSPYGATFTYTGTYDSGIADVPDEGFVVDVDKGGAHVTAHVPGHERGIERDDGVKWHIGAVDDTSAKNSAWIVIEARR